jgi:hypothetical protein
MKSGEKIHLNNGYAQNENEGILIKNYFFCMALLNSPLSAFSIVKFACLFHMI